MLLRRITTEGLVHHSYFLSDGGKALVIDPRRDGEVYLDLAREAEAKLCWILETHRHEDFAVGSCELAHRTDALIGHGKAIPFAYGEGIGDGWETAIGRLRLRALQTPGHTAESLSFTLTDTSSSDRPVLVFSGDALFVGEVGRTDLYGADCREHMAEALYDSLFEKLLPLGDSLILSPAHGGGSVCGANISERDESTLGYERLHNPHLFSDRERFVREKCRERLVIPRYFRRMEEYNLQGPPPLGHFPLVEPLSVERFEAELREGALVVDARMPQAFAGGHIPDSYNIWLEGLPVYAGWVLPLDRPLLLVLPEASWERAARMLLRVGYENLRGVLRGGFESWQNAGKPWQRTGTLDPTEAREMLAQGAVLVDVRNVEEWSEGIIEGSLLLTSAELEGRLDELPKGRPIISTCSVGHRGGIGASILQRHGFEAYNLLGGIKAWRARGYPLVPGPVETRISGISMVTDNSAVGSEIHKAGY